MKRKTRKKKTKTGVSRRSFFALALAAASAFAQSSKEPAPRAVIAGTIFREPGFAAPAAEVVLTAVTPPNPKKKFKPMKITASPRGEFAFQVPPVRASYLVRASLPGHEPQELPAEIHGEERVDLSFNLKLAAKPVK